MSTYILDIEKDIRLPENASEALPSMSQQEELEVYARTIKLLSDLQGKPIEPDEKDQEVAKELAKKMIVEGANIEFANYRNETLAFLAGLVATYNQSLVRDLSEYKTYVVNKLIEHSTNPDPKYAIPALKALGEIEGVDAFKKRSEITVNHRSAEEVEKTLLEKLNKLEKLANMGKNSGVIDVEAKNANARTN